MLSPIEIRLLNKLETGKRYPLQEVARISNLNPDAAMKAAMLLSQRGFVNIYEVKRKKFSLTEEGERYLVEGLPEEKLIRLLRETNDIEELRKKMGNEFQIALGWLKKKGFVNIEGSRVILKSEPTFQEKEALEAIKKGEEIDARILDLLKKRKLVKVEEVKSYEIEVKEKLTLELTEVVADLTPEMIVSGNWRGKKFLAYDVSIPSKEYYGGKIHPYERIIRECRKIFIEMGFKEIKGHYVQPAFWNFDALFQPQDHPAREMQDTFYLERLADLKDEPVEKVKATHENGWITGSSGWGGTWSLNKARQLVLRTHTTAITIHYLAKNPNPPQKAFCIDRVYRREAIDATHLPEFDQLEGVVLDENVGFKHLLGLLKEFFEKMGFEEVRFRPGYFPYTEPSVEPEVYVDGLGWIELGGAGVFRKEVTEPLGIKGKVLAWGIGIGRLAMLKMGLKDLRRLYLPDIEWLRKMPSRW
ncbi:MAG: phenylalanine--tRNA ligase subunit alpha [Archaeoglobales archaeon]|nr:phenylalanine--tRNA ligase subunit alpha [Archaeoglobales archaeon]